MLYSLLNLQLRDAFIQLLPNFVKKILLKKTTHNLIKNKQSNVSTMKHCYSNYINNKTNKILKSPKFLIKNHLQLNSFKWSIRKKKSLIEIENDDDDKIFNNLPIMPKNNNETNNNNAFEVNFDFNLKK